MFEWLLNAVSGTSPFYSEARLLVANVLGRVNRLQ